MAKTCLKCNHITEGENARFCGNCGSRFDTQTAQPQAPFTAQPVAPPVTGYTPYAINTTPIVPLNTPLVKEQERKILAFYYFVFLGAHMLRYMLVTNNFPSPQSFIEAVLLYALFTPMIILPLNSTYHKHGVENQVEISKFDYTFSFVLSTFFIGTASFLLKIDNERSILPDKIVTMDYDKGRVIERTLRKSKYIGEIVVKEAYRRRFYIFLAVGYVVFIANFLIPFTFTESVRLFVGFVGSMSFMEVAPSLGRKRDKIMYKNRWIGFLLIILSGFLFIVGFNPTIAR